MKLETIQLSKLNPAEYNPRQITKEEFEGLKVGSITYEQAKLLSKPVIDSINEDIAVIAKKNNRKPYKLNFSGLMR